MRSKRTLFLLLLTLMTLVLGAVAVITSMRLKEMATVPVTPNVPVSQPRAATPADTTTKDCETAFTVAAIACFEGTCTVDDDCGEYECQEGVCVNSTCPTEEDCICPGATPTPTPTPSPTPTPTPAPTPTPTPAPGCDDHCSKDSDCTGGLKCLDNACRNSACPADKDCVCDKKVTPTPTPAAQETLPEAGTTLPTVVFLGAGAILLIIGILAAGLL